MSDKNLRYGQRVEVKGKPGVVRECGDKYKVKFDDGSFGFFVDNEISPIVEASSLKSNRKYDRMKAESVLESKTIFMNPPAEGADPLAQPVHHTKAGLGTNQSVLGKSTQDKFHKAMKEDEETEKAMTTSPNGKFKVNDNVKTPKGDGKITNITEDLVSVSIDGKIEKFDEEDLSKSMEEKTMAKKEKLADKENEDIEKEEEDEDETQKEFDHTEPDEDNEGGESDNDDDNQKKKKKAKKAGIAQDPIESAEDSTTNQHTTTEGEVIGNKQDVLVPPSAVSGKREQTTPMDKSYNPDLTKSPLYVGLQKQLGEMQKEYLKRVEAMEKSMTARINNIMKRVEQAEEFEKKSLHKAVGENNAPEATQKMTIAKQIADGNVRYR